MSLKEDREHSFASSGVVVDGLALMMTRPPRPTRKGLYAVVMPCGGGKTTTAEMLDQLDVDKVLPDGIENSLRHMRHDAEVAGSVEEHRAIWKRHNSDWVAYLNSAFDSYCFRMQPRVLFCHSPEIALLVGAEIILVASPTADLHEEQLRGRDSWTLDLCRRNRVKNILVSGNHELFHEYWDSIELMRLVATAMARVDYWPGLSQYLGSNATRVCARREGYREPVPDYLYREVYEEGCIDELLTLVDDKLAPSWHVYLWSKRHDMGLPPKGTNYEAAYQWLQLGCEVKAFTLAAGAKRGKGITRGCLADENVDWFEIFPFCDRTTQATAGVTLRGFLKYYGAANVSEYGLRILNAHLGSHHTFVLAILMFYEGSVKKMDHELVAMIEESRVLEVPQVEWIRLHKVLHDLVRSNNDFFGLTLTTEEYVALQYTAALHGRRPYEMDGLAEMKKRTEYRLEGKKSYWKGMSCEQYVPDFTDGVRIAYSRIGCKKRRKWATFEEFFAQRYEWATEGAVTELPSDMSHYKKVSDVMVEIDREIISLKCDSSKKGILEQMESPSELARYIVKHHGRNITRMAPKPNEPAKKRVLLPGGFIHYVVVSYLLGSVERTGDIGGARVGNPEDNNISHYDLRMASSVFNFMLDFADHNAQHSILEMQIIMAELESYVMENTDVRQTQYLMDWVVDSFENMVIMTPEGESVVNSGLFTGWRSTTWINSVACQAYCYVGACVVKRQFGTDCLDYFEAAGDDVLMRFSSAVGAYRFHKAMVDIGFDMQTQKQMMSADTTEFLRVVCVNGTMRTAVNRILPNFVCGNLERSRPRVLERAAGAYATVHLMIRRGMSREVALAAYGAYLHKWMKFVKDDELVRIHPSYIHGAIECGGMGIPDHNDRIWLLNGILPKTPIPEYKVRGAARHATDDYVERLSEELSQCGLRLRKNECADRIVEMRFANQVLAQQSECFLEGLPLVGYLEPALVIDKELLADVLRSCNSAEVSAVEGQVAKWGRYHVTVPYINATEEEIKERLGITIDVTHLDSVRMPVYFAFMVPDYVLSNVTKYYRAMVVSGRLGLENALANMCVCAYTYSQVFADNGL